MNSSTKSFPELISFLDGQAEPSIVMDAEYRIVAANSAYTREFAQGRDVNGKACYEVSHHFTVPCDQAGESCPLRMSQQSGQMQRVLHLHHTPRGEEHVDVSTAPIRDDKGRLAYFVETMRVVKHASSHPAAEGLVGRAASFSRMLSLVMRVAPTDAAVLLLGETGTGKELVARVVHEAGRSAEGPFVAVDCSGLTESLFESELFGYEKGAFTGAAKTTPGKIETAHNGTLMLDEIGDLPHSLQAKLLRFLQERVIERIGGREEIPVDVRIVCATHQDVKGLIQTGRFREDLYYRLAEIVVDIPALRERDGDAVLLAHAFVQRFANDHGRGSMTLTDDAVQSIESHRWPGNIRELENAIKRAVIMAEGNCITSDDVGLDVSADDELDALNLRVVREEAERRAVVRVIARVNGNVARAAEVLGISRPTLYDLMNRFGLKKETST